MGGTILVTGGAGYVGSHCVLELLKAGYKVRFDSKTVNIRKKWIRPTTISHSLILLAGDCN